MVQDWGLLPGWGGPPGLPSSAISLFSSTAKLEPGVFGIFRPVLWLPAGIADRLEDAEPEAILTHELCHIRRRDNLFAGVHMLVEAPFWFHPLVWWLGARLEEERERASDEDVVRMGGEPQIYAEGILKVVEFYLASPVPCATGVTGGELRQRIEGIMTSRFIRKLGYGKKRLLAVTATVAVSAPIAISSVSPPRGRAQRGEPANVHPAFEVASVKPIGASNGNGPRRSPGIVTDPELLRYPSATPKGLVEFAYAVKDYQVTGPWRTRWRISSASSWSQRKIRLRCSSSITPNGPARTDIRYCYVPSIMLNSPHIAARGST